MEGDRLWQLADPLRAVLDPMNGQMLGHPWAPSMAAADLLCRLDRLAGDTRKATDTEEKAAAMYERLGATTFAERLAAHTAPSD